MTEKTKIVDLALELISAYEEKAKEHSGYGKYSIRPKDESTFLRVAKDFATFPDFKPSVYVEAAFRVEWIWGGKQIHRPYPFMLSFKHKILPVYNRLRKLNRKAPGTKAAILKNAETCLRVFDLKSASSSEILLALNNKMLPENVLVCCPKKRSQLIRSVMMYITEASFEGASAFDLWTQDELINLSSQFDRKEGYLRGLGVYKEIRSLLRKEGL